MGRRFFAGLAALLLAAGLVALSVYLWTQPRTLTLAVGPLGSDDARLAAALVQGLSREKKPVRLRLVLTEGSAESARKIDAGKVDLDLTATASLRDQRSGRMIFERRPLQVRRQIFTDSGQLQAEAGAAQQQPHAGHDERHGDNEE